MNMDNYIEGSVVVEKGAFVFNSVLKGKTVIKKGSCIENSIIDDSIVEEDAMVKSSTISNSEIGRKSTIGPYAHIRLNSIIGDECRIGNFVEIKNSLIGYKTNICHLAYVGDTLCGSGVNFGCGVVIVNYDGKCKNKTIIGDNVFIGCNSNIIAPIVIKDNAFIASGSTITDDIDEFGFAIARSRQITKANYSQKYGYKKV